MCISFRHVLVFSVWISCGISYGQQPSRAVSMDEAVSISLINNPAAKNAELKLKKVTSSPLALIETGNTQIEYFHGQLHTGDPDFFLKVTQNLGSPLTHLENIRYEKQWIKYSEAEQRVAIKQITAAVKSAYNLYVYQVSRVKIFHSLSPLYDQLLNVEGVPYPKNDSDLLSRITTETLFAYFQNEQFKSEQEARIAGNEFSLLLNTAETISPADTFLDLYAIQIKNMGPDKFSAGSIEAKYNESIHLQERNIKMEQSRYFPELMAGYFNQQINRQKGYQGFYMGFAVPLWFFPQKTKISREKINLEMIKNESDFQKFFISKKIESLKIRLDQLYVNISFYRENSLKKAELLLKDADGQIRSKNIHYRDCLEKLQAALAIHLEYLESLKSYNQTAIELESYID